MTRINGKTKIVGIFGWPVEHTLSPAMHNAAFDRLKMNYVYVPFPVESGRLGEAVNAIRALGLAGVNVTVPHKEKVMKFLDGLDGYARKIGAVNTIINKGGRLIGFNTDAYGFKKTLIEKKVVVKKKVVLILGAGGAAKAAGICIAEKNPEKIYIYDIDKKKSKALAVALNGTAVEKTSLTDILKNTDVLINATPAGMRPGDKPPVEISICKKTMFVYDLIYNRETELIKEAKAKGLKFSDGLDMLLYQGIRAFELWTRKKAPVEVMKHAILNEIKGRGGDA